ncbi:uncharacterized protein LOC124163713 [Ischnura elegans]|uniref:uncharacterized protein LOC124163713 n=1 Tax=Ischnura elegans TaxID=197161 RepID=UPI001ED86BFA|nr:uncharacterized protein LOC124163713 [Ischnura elegans]
MVNSSCGFDLNFFELLQLRVKEIAPMERHGILSIDEIHLRENVSVCSKSLTYKGLIDFGEDGPKAMDFDSKANHALVLMFQPLSGSFQQAIATFAGRGPTEGAVLAKIVIKAIILLERVGLVVHGIVSDCAATNRKMWSELGVSGARNGFKNYFEHPAREGRNVYVFADTPHLIKNVRNRLYNSKELKV